MDTCSILCCNSSLIHIFYNSTVRVMNSLVSGECSHTITYDMFLVDKCIAMLQIGASIYASNIGAPMFIGLAGTAAASGFSVTIYEWHVRIYLFVCLFWPYLTRELIWHESIFHKALKDGIFFIFFIFLYIKRGFLWTTYLHNDVKCDSFNYFGLWKKHVFTNV